MVNLVLEFWVVVLTVLVRRRLSLLLDILVEVLFFHSVLALRYSVDDTNIRHRFVFHMQSICDVRLIIAFAINFQMSIPNIIQILV